ncbi:MAG: hypothetical protein KDB03_26070 [Planctomycetales bacterium]|nr:hypothetical protein [Planctomycetales bacterium]
MSTASTSTQFPTEPRLATWEVLEKTRNTAAVNVLAQGLHCKQPDVHTHCLNILLGRQEPQACLQLILNWDALSPRDIETVRAQSHQFRAAMDEIFAGPEASDKRAALQCIEDLDLVESVDHVLSILTQKASGIFERAHECMQSMCSRWGRRARDHAPCASRSVLVEKVGTMLMNSADDQREIFVRLWLRLAHWDDSIQRGLVSDHRHPAYSVLFKEFRRTDDPAVLELLAGYLIRNTSNNLLTEILAEKPNHRLAIQIAHLMSPKTRAAAIKHLSICSPLACLRDPPSILANQTFEVQCSIWLAIAANSRNLGQVLQGAILLSQSASSAGREVAAKMLEICHKPTIEQVVSAIQFAHSKMSDESAVGHYLLKLQTWFDSPSSLLRDAVKEFFKEFNLQELVRNVQKMPAPMCKAMAEIVRRIDSDITTPLAAELDSPAPKRRLDAMQVIQHLDLISHFSSQLMQLLDDPRVEIRVRAIDMLSVLENDPLEFMLPKLLEDLSSDVQEAAGRALRRRKRNKAST